MISAKRRTSSSPWPRWFVIISLLGAGVGRAQEISAATSRSPNIVVFLADDLGWNDVSWHNSQVKTPNLERLRREGITLTHQYVAPVCSPTRSALLSGRFPTRFGISDAQNERAFPFETVTLASALKERGYETALIGKWHLGSAPEWGPQKYGFDYSYGTLAGGCGPYSHRYKPGEYAESWHRNGNLIKEEGHVTDLIAREAVNWLGGRGEKPFFLYVAFTAPHVPIKETPEFLVQNSGVAVPAKREFYSSVSHMDWGVGQVMAALQKSGQRENTIVLWLSDNGATPNQENSAWLTTDDPREKFTPGPAGGSNDPLRGQKTQVYEGGIRVPAFVNWPGRLKSGQFDGVMHVADWMPTFCALAKYQSKSELKWDGRDMWPALTGKVGPPARQLYWVSSSKSSDSAVRDGDWKMIVSKTPARTELFNLAEDPNERDDRAGRETERVANLRALLAALARNDNDAQVPRPPARLVHDEDNDVLVAPGGALVSTR